MSRAAIVGGGIGGLTSALLLSRRGVEVTLYERAPEVGGRVRFETDGRYAIDQGPTIVLLPEMLQGILEEGGLPREALTLLRCDPLYRVHFAGGRTLTKVDGTDKQADEIERLYPGEGDGFRRFMRETGPLFPKGRASFLERPFLSRREFFSPANLALMARLQAFRSIRDAMGRYFRSEELKDAFSLQSLYIGGAPFRTPGIYTMLPYAEQQFGVWMLKGGYGELPRIMARELERRGVHMVTNTEVQSLVVEDGRCKGVVVNGERHVFDAVLYNGEFPHLAGLLQASGTEGSSAVRRAPRRREMPKPRNYQPSSGCLLIYAGAKRRWEDALTHQFFLPESLDASLRELFENKVIPARPSYYVFNPAALDGEAAPEGESALYFLVPVPSGDHIDWMREGEALASRVLEDAERRGFPGLRESIVWRTIRTPADAAADGLYGGGSFGIAPVLAQSGVFRPQPKPYPIKGLFAAGASVHPGGGVPIVMQGAKLAVEEMTKELTQR